MRRMETLEKVELASREVQVDGRRVHYVVRPGGPRSIVFLHGGFGSSSELWAGVMATLPSLYTGYAIDNFIRSEGPPEGYTVTAFAKRAAGFISTLGLGRAVVGGHSMGGVVSQLVALNHPEVVGGLVLVCTGPAMTNHELGRRLLAHLRDNGRDPAAMREISGNWFHLDPPEEFFDGYVARALQAPLDAMISAQESLIATDLRSRLPQIKVPALVVFGRHDIGRTIDHAEALAGGIPGAELAVMERSGHSPMIETPSDFDRTLHPFLDRVYQA